ETPLTTGSGIEKDLTLSVDQRIVVFASNRDGRWAEYVAPLDAIPVSDPVRLAYLDGDPADLPRDGIRWTSSGRLILGYSTLDQNIYRINIDPSSGRATSRPERLTQDAPRNQNPSISPDSKHIAYVLHSGGRQRLAVMDANGSNERPIADLA